MLIASHKMLVAEKQFTTSLMLHLFNVFSLYFCTFRHLRVRLGQIRFNDCEIVVFSVPIELVHIDFLLGSTATACICLGCFFHTSILGGVAIQRIKQVEDNGG